MQIVLTDVLTCPRCGPAFGLIVLADRLVNRRVLEGRLGCANCRESYEIRSGVAHLALPSLDPAPVDVPQPPDPEEAVRLAALLGLSDTRGLVLLVGRPAALAGALVELVPEITVGAVGPHVAGLEDHSEVSRVFASAVLPFRDRSAAGIALGGDTAVSLLDEAIRTLRPGSRLVADDIPHAAERLASAGLSVLLDEERIVVATGPSGR